MKLIECFMFVVRDLLTENKMQYLSYQIAQWHVSAGYSYPTQNIDHLWIRLAVQEPFFFPLTRRNGLT